MNLFASNIINTNFIIIQIFCFVSARKYDIESESSRLYGEDFGTILQKFRKSPDYLQILEEKYNEMLLFFGEVSTYALQYTMDNRLRERVAEMCGYEESTTTPLAYYKAHGRRQEDETSTVTVSDRNPIDLLEKYSHFSNVLTTQERNSIRDLAFEVTGQMIHMIIKSMGPVDSGPKSTRLPYGGDAGAGSSTTVRDENHKHSITKGLKEEGTEPPEEPNYRF